MLRTLLESNAAPARRRGGILISIGLHTAAIALAVAATARANIGPRDILPDPFARPLPYIEMPIYPADNFLRPESKHRWVCDCGVPPIRGVPPVPISVASPEINDKLPPIQDDFRRDLTTLCFHCKEQALVDGRSRGLASPTDLYTGPTVDWAARPKSGNPTPIYPSALRSAQLEGMVIARFVVDTVGRAEPASIDILETTHPLFGEAVRQALIHSRYEPAMVGDHRVRQLVEQRFTFSLIR